MVIVKKLSAKFQIQFTSESSNSFLDAFGLHFQIFFVIKTNLVHESPCEKLFINKQYNYTNFCRINQQILLAGPVGFYGIKPDL